jgi:hypothetical protein
LVAVEDARVGLGLPPPWQSLGIDEVEILVTIPIVVEYEYSVSRRLENVVLLGAAGVGHDVEIGGGGAIDKLGSRLLKKNERAGEN